jgi:hypothetical protein
MPVPALVAKIRPVAGIRRMFLQIALPALSFGALCGCMTLGDPVPPPAPFPFPAAEIRPAIVPEPVSVTAPAVPLETRSRPAAPPRTVREMRVQPAARPARPRTPSLDPDQLIGLDPSAVQKLLGAPSRIRDDKLSREWVYALPGCNFRVFFYPNLNAAAFRVLKYSGNDDNGERLAASNACVRRILMARANAAD